jgi:hypothetical protein
MTENRKSTLLSSRISRRALFGAGVGTLGGAIVFAFARGTRDPGESTVYYHQPGSSPIGHTGVPNCACPRCVRYDGPSLNA